MYTLLTPVFNYVPYYVPFLLRTPHISFRGCTWSKVHIIHHKLGDFGVGVLNVGPLILKYSTLLGFHRALHERDSLSNSKVVTFIVKATELILWNLHWPKLFYEFQHVQNFLLFICIVYCKFNPTSSLTLNFYLM